MNAEPNALVAPRLTLAERAAFMTQQLLTYDPSFDENKKVFHQNMSDAQRQHNVLDYPTVLSALRTHMQRLLQQKNEQAEQPDSDEEDAVLGPDYARRERIKLTWKDMGVDIYPPGEQIPQGDDDAYEPDAWGYFLTADGQWYYELFCG